MHIVWRGKAGLSFASVLFLDAVCGITSCHSVFCCCRYIAKVNRIILTKQELTAKFPCANFCKYTFIIYLAELYIEKSSLYIENFITISKDMSSGRKINPLILCNPGLSWWFFSPFLCEIALGMKTEKYSRENDVALNPGVIYISTYNRQSETVKYGPIYCIFFRHSCRRNIFKWEFYSQWWLFSIILKQ